MLQRASRNQKGHTLALGSVNWEQPGHKTAGSVLQKVNRSYHSIWPSQCWASAGGEQIIQKRPPHPSVHCTSIYHRPRRHAHLEVSFRDGDKYVGHTQSHTYIHTHTHIHTFTGIGQHDQKVGKMPFPATWTETLTTGEATQRRNNCLSKLHWYSLEGTV